MCERRLKMCRSTPRYSPETKEAKKQRLMQMAESQEKGKQVETKKPLVLKYGLNHVTSLIESKQAKLVVIPHDVTSALPALSKQLHTSELLQFL